MAGKQPVESQFNCNERPATFCEGFQYNFFQAVFIYAKNDVAEAGTDVIFDPGYQLVCFGFAPSLGRNTDVHDACVRSKTDRWIDQRLEIADLFIDRAFAESGTMQNADFDDIMKIETRLQIRDNGLVQNVFHFVGTTG